MKKQRDAARRARRNLDILYRDSASLEIQRQLLRSRHFFSSSSIACYLSMYDEVDTSLIFDRAWKSGKRIYAPVVASQTRMKFVRVEPDTQLMKSRFGLWEPADGAEICARKLDVVVTPVVAFDDANNRIGMGSGYYDRAFAFLKGQRHWLPTKLLGLAFNCQEVEKITPNPWDIPLYRVFSETV